ncbi:5'/3'-nucleotidase SurE [Halanaerobiaceae bacterium Z-7014]|uniref:5'-nucleotidase SurE n=1 Tax=Halonatronomonas betaini TaxID=2778430 RepID=A0A931AVT8_9FIRM|nr:5'/3'-nucleotidase SurE [Halonatronomonas betaini]MBF8437685.1 5'/3'-nucleotidase SurE [Halonatronomonas betaini]
MKILLVNDDGIYAEGINSLAEALIEAGHQLKVIAPDQERSAISHAITIRKPLRLFKTVSKRLGNDAYRVNGTPADCIKLALKVFEDFKPDLVISGINHGHNLGYDVYYSGTVSAAIEAYIQGYKAIAVSLSIDESKNFTAVADKLVDYLSNDDFIETLNLLDGPLNINFPDLKYSKYNGYKITTLAPHLYEDSVEERIDPAGGKYFWFRGGNKSYDDDKADINAIKNGFISITPLNLNISDDKKIDILNDNLSLD